MWHKSLSKHIRVNGAHDPRVLSITYKDDRLFLLLVNVYLPTNVVLDIATPRRLKD